MKLTFDELVEKIEQEENSTDLKINLSKTTEVWFRKLCEVIDYEITNKTENEDVFQEYCDSLDDGCKDGDDEYFPVNDLIEQRCICESCNTQSIQSGSPNELPSGSQKVLDFTVKEDMLEAIKVIFLKPIFEEDFPERGMKAWLTGVERIEDDGCWELYFDFTEFEKENDKYLRGVYYTDKYELTQTAKDLGEYSNKYSVCFGDISYSVPFDEQISEFIKRTKN